jgi:hypothetical protein
MSYRSFSLTWSVAPVGWWNNTKYLNKKELIPVPYTNMAAIHCFGTPIWPPWRQMKTIYWTSTARICFFYINDNYGDLCENRTVKREFLVQSPLHANPETQSGQCLQYTQIAVLVFRGMNWFINAYIIICYFVCCQTSRHFKSSRRELENVRKKDWQTLNVIMKC